MGLSMDMDMGIMWVLCMLGGGAPGPDVAVCPAVGFAGEPEITACAGASAEAAGPEVVAVAGPLDSTARPGTEEPPAAVDAGAGAGPRIDVLVRDWPELIEVLVVLAGRGGGGMSMKEVVE